MGDVYVHANADSSGGTKLATIEDIPDVPVTDVQVNGTSVVTTGVANIVVGNGITITSGAVSISPATDARIKKGIGDYNAIVPPKQHLSIFYGLSKAAGVDLANETVTLGTYPETSKTAIKAMLGVQDGLKVVRLI